MADERLDVLMHAVRGPVVLKYCGQLSLVLAAFMSVPCIFALINEAWPLLFRYVVLMFGLIGFAFLSIRIVEPQQIQVNEALTITALAFIGSTLLSAWPFQTSGLSFIDALFEATSAVTTTGLSTLGSVDNIPVTLLFSRAWVQWVGGLGIVVLAVALVMQHHSVTRRLTNPRDSGESFAVTARAHARHCVIIYVALTLIGLLLLWPFTENTLDAVIHILTAVSTGGFSNNDDSLAGLHSKTAAVIVTGISFMGAVSIPLYWRVKQRWRQAPRIVFEDTELRALFIACIIVSVLLGAMNWIHGQPQPWYNGIIMGVSAQTTTGFSSVNVAEMNTSSKLIMIAAMIVGGSAGSSAGGVKLIRLLMFIRLLQLTLQRTTIPVHSVSEPYLQQQKLDQDDLLKALQLILLFVIIIFVSWLPFVFAGYNALDALFEVVSATATVGLSAGISSPNLESWLKAVLCFDMVAGRLEIIALFVVLYPRNWIGRRAALP